jgi:hypothetical protein
MARRVVYWCADFSIKQIVDEILIQVELDA